MKRKSSSKHLILDNPVFRATVTAAVKRDMQKLKAMAEMQVWASNHAANVVYMTSRILWIVDHAANACRIPMDSPEMRIIGGAANALGDLAAHPDELELHRPALQAAIMAADRLWPRLDAFAMGNAAVDFNRAIQTEGLSTHSFYSCRPKESATEAV